MRGGALPFGGEVRDAESPKQRAMQGPGTLYIVGTPIGNLEDITLRALRVLREVAVIAAEDTRVTQTLLRKHGIQTPLTSYHQHTAGRKAAEVVAMLKGGKSVALVSDAGMPGFSDPGARLVTACAGEGIPVVVIPGPTASSAALAVSGFSGREHLFLGFLPAKRGERRKALEGAAGFRGALVVYEAPHRVLDTLRDMVEVLGERSAVAARELTKKFEETVRGTLSELTAHFAAHEPRGEFTIVVGGPAEEVGAHGNAPSDMLAAVAEVRDLIGAGLSRSRAVAHVAKHRGIARNALYRAVVVADTGQERGGGDAETSPPYKGEGR
ncbi:MAG: 16S rRNA (cytidine(1402)-2'-O)-methyltransferase [Armatimonadota bacterium]